MSLGDQIYKVVSYTVSAGFQQEMACKKGKDLNSWKCPRQGRASQYCQGLGHWVAQSTACFSMPLSFLFVVSLGHIWKLLKKIK